jgi:acyl-CoA synthetase (AMP-forming)/AMP-acid ligase II
VSPIYFFLVFVWGVAMAGVVVMAFQTKLTKAEADAKTEISQCKIDYELNRYFLLELDAPHPSRN